MVVDGTEGVVIIHPTEETLVQYHERKTRYEKFQTEIIHGSHVQAITTDDIQVHVMGNIELPDEVVSVLAHGGDGIGLYRTEFQYLSGGGFPNEEELFDKYKNVAEAVLPRPVTIRTLDINGDKAIIGASDSNEVNPAMGLRAIRYCLAKPEVFTIQLRAILRAAAFGNIRIMFPMISSYDEILAAKRMLQEAADSLDKEKVLFNRDVKIGIMIEVPAAVIQAEVMAEAVDFFSIGTNDLVQYSLAIDRGNREVAHLYNPVHPAVLSMIKQAVDAAQKKGIDICMCGEMAADPLNIPVLLGLGVKELSMTSRSIPTVKNMIRLLSVKDSMLFTEKLLKENTSKGALKLQHDRYSGLVDEISNTY